jgi:proteasome activator subunit 4
LTGILAASPEEDVTRMVQKYIPIADESKIKRPKSGPPSKQSATLVESIEENDAQRTQNQKTSVFFLCSAIMAQPYDTPIYVPAALAAISKHSFKRNAPLAVRDTVKRCCAEYKKTHMSDNWEMHRVVFSQEQLEALEDVVSTPHYYA